MRLYYAQIPNDENEISILAILETVFAIVAVVATHNIIGSTKLFLLSICLSPLFLLRTTFSDKVATYTYNRIVVFLDCGEAQYLTGIKAIAMLLRNIGSLIILFFLIGLISRVIAILVAAFIHPVLTVRAIPGNWVRTACCIDSTLPPSVLPGDPAFSFSSFLAEFRKARKGWLYNFFLVFFGICQFTPSILYRWSLKATSFVYLPLLWILFNTSYKVTDLYEHLMRVRKSDVSRVVLVWSVIALFLLILKLVLMNNWNEFVDLWNSTKLAQFFALYVVPDKLPLWQLASAVNAMIAIGTFIFAGEALLRYGKDDAWHEGQIRIVMNATAFVKSVLTLYTISCTFLITWRAIISWNTSFIGPIFP